MARDPEYGVPLTADDIALGLPIFPIYGVTPSDEYMPIQVNSAGQISISGVTITGPVTVNDVTIRGVDPDNSNTPEDIAVFNFGADGYAMRTTIVDGPNHATVNPDGSLNVTAMFSGTIGLNNIALAPINPATEDTLSALNTKVTTTAAGIRVDGSAATQPVSGSVAVTNFPATQPISGTVSISGSVAVTGTFFQATQPISAVSLPLPTGAATETTLLALDTKVTTTANGIKVDGSAVVQPVSGTVTVGNASIPVTQSGAWSVGRTWALASGTDSVAAAQSGTWNINNISGVISLPSGAATESTLSNISADVAGLTFVATRLLVDGSGVTQPISAVSLPLPTGAATETTLSALNTKFTTTVNGLKVDGSAVTQPVSGTVSVNNFPSTQPVSGTVAVTQATGTNLHAVIDSGAITATPPALPAAAATGQAVIAVTGTAVQLASNALVNGVVITSNTTNTANITIGGSGVTNTINGTGNGYVLAPGAATGIAVANTNALYVNGTAGDVVSFVGS